MILDTTFLIDVMRNDEKAVAKVQEFIKKGEPQLVAAPSLFELFSSLARSSKPAREKQKIADVLVSQLVVPLDARAAERAGTIDGELVKRGSAIGPVDSMIAGIALEKNEPVLTRNTKDFERVKGLGVQSY